MAKSKIGIYTYRSLSPVHPRLEAFYKILENEGYEVSIINHRENWNSIGSRINWISLWFFDFYGIFLSKRSVKNYDVIFVMDLKILPLVRYAKRMGKKVFYDTIDNGVHLRYYQLKKKLPVTKIFGKIILSTFQKLEKKYAFKFCDKIIVNSKALLKYFDNQAALFNYYSPFEFQEIENNPKNSAALIYLGAFTYEKGAKDILNIRERLNLPLFIFGDIDNDYIRNEIEKSTLIKISKRLGKTELKKELKLLVQEYYLLGLSLIKPVNFSYATQEANKDIDYLAMGIPIIGNYRLTTEEKIIAGCGVFYNQPEDIHKLLTDTNLRKNITANCKSYYRDNYSAASFDKRVLELFKNTLQT